MLVLVLAVAGTVLAAILLAIETRRPLANRLLAGLVLALAFRLLALVLMRNDAGWLLRVAYGLFNGMFLVGPLLYGYARALVEPAFRLRPAHLWHALPALLGVVWSVLSYLGPPQDLAAIRVTAAHGLLSNLSLIIYAELVRRTLLRHRLQLLDRYAAIERISLDWLRLLALAILLLGAAVAMVNAPRLAIGWDLDATELAVLPITILIYVAVILFGFRQASAVLIGPALEPAPAAKPEPEPAAEDARYLRSGLDPVRASRLWQRLETLMDTEQLFLDPELDLNTLAERIGVGAQTLSELLNSHGGVKFYDYVNRRRVAAAQRLLREPVQATATVLDIALRAGFSSKSTFNKYFKQELGLTPTEYRQRPAG
jgi:AraC-like DNA-binding protein